MTKQELENRLINFASNIIQLTAHYEDSYAGRHPASQIIRSATSPALNYGEAQNAESHKDFVHKMGICTKELKETFVNLKIVEQACLVKNNIDIIELKTEVNELISIFVASIKTLKGNLK